MNIEELVKMPSGAGFVVELPSGSVVTIHSAYTADQLRAYGEAVAAAVAKRCADLCQQIAYSHQARPMLGPEMNSLNCAYAIRREFGEVSNA